MSSLIPLLAESSCGIALLAVVLVVAGINTIVRRMK